MTAPDTAIGELSPEIFIIIQLGWHGIRPEMVFAASIDAGEPPIGRIAGPGPRERIEADIPGAAAAMPADQANPQCGEALGT